MEDVQWKQLELWSFLATLKLLALTICLFVRFASLELTQSEIQDNVLQFLHNGGDTVSFGSADSRGQNRMEPVKENSRTPWSLNAGDGEEGGLNGA